MHPPTHSSLLEARQHPLFPSLCSGSDRLRNPVFFLLLSAVFLSLLQGCADFKKTKEERAVEKKQWEAQKEEGLKVQRERQRELKKEELSKFQRELQRERQRELQKADEAKEDLLKRFRENAENIAFARAEEAGLLERRARLEQEKPGWWELWKNNAAWQEEVNRLNHALQQLQNIYLERLLKARKELQHELNKLGLMPKQTETTPSFPAGFSGSPANPIDLLQMERRSGNILINPTDSNLYGIDKQGESSGNNSEYP